MASKLPASQSASVIAKGKVGFRSDLHHKAALLYGDAGGKNLVKALASDGASAVMLYRIADFCFRTKLTPIGFLMAKLNKVLNGVVIGRGAKIGPGFVIQHSAGVVINGKVVIGADCVVQSGVAIGAHSAQLREVPTIGDSVAIGSGAKVIGGITVGNRAGIGANAVVVHDVPDDTTVVGIPAKPIK